jgi:hypothetical protein
VVGKIPSNVLPVDNSARGRLAKQKITPYLSVKTGGAQRRDKTKCKICGRKNSPGRINHGFYFCTRCCRTAGIPARQKRWDDGDIPRCKRHPERLVNRSYWVRNGTRKCAACVARYDGTDIRRMAHVRAHKSEQRRWRNRSTALYQRISEMKI